jgi:hypothetical protein
MRRLLILTLAGLAIGAGSSGASAKSHIQSISKSIAEAFCAPHGGGTSCNFCDPRHCHVIGCDSQGKNCKNAVMGFRPTQGSGVRTPVGTVKGGVVATGPVHRPIQAAPVLNQGGSMGPAAAMHHGGRH